MGEFVGSILGQIRVTTLLDIAIVSLLIYGLFSLIRGTRAVRLVIGVSVLIVVYVLAVAFGLELLTRILQGGAVVGLFALVVIFQPEIRRALERIGRVGSFGWVLPGADSRAVDHDRDRVGPETREGVLDRRPRSHRLRPGGMPARAAERVLGFRRQGREGQEADRPNRDDQAQMLRAPTSEPAQPAGLRTLFSLKHQRSSQAKR